jgi:predicted HTH domain antitoxin
VPKGNFSVPLGLVKQFPMSLVITDEEIKITGLSAEQLKLEIAVLLFQKEIFTLGLAAEFCGLHKIEMQRELAKRKIPLHYDIDMLHEDIANINEP